VLGGDLQLSERVREPEPGRLILRNLSSADQGGFVQDKFVLKSKTCDGASSDTVSVISTFGECQIKTIANMSRLMLDQK